MASKRVQYKKALARAKREIKKAERLGYVIDEELDLTLPKRITKKNLEEVKRITKSIIYRKQSNKKRVAKPEQPKSTSRIVNIDYSTGRKRGSRSVQLNKLLKEYKPFTNPISTKQRKDFEQQAKQGDSVSPTTLSIIDLYYQYIQEYQEKLSQPIGRYSGYKWEIYELAVSSFDSISTVFENKVNEMDNNGALDTYADYLQDKASEFVEALKVITYASQIEIVQARYIEAVGIINQGALTFSQAVNLENTYGYIND